jgi:Transcriptional regulator
LIKFDQIFLKIKELAELIIDYLVNHREYSMKKQIKDKRTAIMEAALKLFTQRGLHGTSTAQISKEAGVATGTLFNYFPTKDDLINSLYFEMKGKLSRSMGKEIESEITFQEKRCTFLFLLRTLLFQSQKYFL